MWILGMMACSGDSVEPPPPPPVGESGVVTLSTRDGVELVGDVYAGEPGSAGVVLLHMTPSGPWNRGDWPASFISKLTDEGWSVLAIDRRGAGESGGDPVDAYEGEAGRYDVEAAVIELDRRGVGPIALIGASNGTTSALDYAVWAGSEGLPVPVALGMMTGGSYTENQNPMSDLGDTPTVFTYSTAERDWSVEQQAIAADSWVFEEYPNGAHGTQMFDVAPEVEDDLAAFFAAIL